MAETHEIEASAKKGKEKFSLELAWGQEKEEEKKTSEFSISAAEPLIENKPSEEEEKPFSSGTDGKAQNA